MPRSTTKLIASGSALQVVRFGAGVVVAFFLTPFIIHSLGDRLYGFWTLAAAFIGYYGLMDLGLAGAAARYIAGAVGKGDQEEYSKVFSTALQLYVVLGVAVLAISIGIAFLAPRFVHSAQDAALFRDVILILGCGLAVGFPLRAYAGLLVAELRLDAVAVIDIFTLLLRTVLVVCVLLMGYKLLALAWVTFFCGLPGKAAYMWLSRRQCPWLRFHPQPWLGQWTKSLLSYSAYALVGSLADQLRFNADSFVITAFVGLAAVTHFRIAGLMVTYFMSLMVALVGIVRPLFSRLHGAGDYRSIQKTLLFSTKVSACVAGFVGFGFIAWGKPFIQRWVGVSYLDAYPCLVVLALGYIVALGQMPSVPFLYGISKHKYLAIMNTVEGIANLALSIWLIRSMGIFGVALGTFIPMALVRLFVQPLYVCHVSTVPYGDYMRELGRSALVVGAALVVPALISVRLAAPTYSSLTMVALASFVCYAAVVGLFQFTRQERETLLRAILPSRKLVGYPPVLSEGDAR